MPPLDSPGRAPLARSDPDDGPRGPTPSALTTALAGRYAIERELGAGGMATVWLAHDLRHERRVAIKVLRPELSAVLGPERFLAEIRTTAGLQHPHLLPLFDSGAAEGLLYYVMPYVEGETLRARLERERQLPVADAVRLAREVADALGYAHARGVVHRDVKPENVLLQGGRGSAPHALVADFGIALAVQQAGGARMTQTGLSLGTPQYMAPEQALGERAVDARADVYALGAVTYEMLTGEPPFTGPTVQAIVAKLIAERPTPPGRVRDTVPAAVEAAVLRALAKLPADRFASAAEFAAALQAPAPARAAARVGRPRAATAALGAALGAACLAAGAAGAWAWARRRPAATDAPPVRFTIDLPRGVAFDNVFAPLTISHDGRTVVFRALVNDTVRLVRRDLDRLDVVPIAGTEGAGWPALSPDDRWLAFQSDGVIRRISLDGGPAMPMADGPTGGLAWASSDTLVVAQPGLRLIPLAGGAGRQVVLPDTAARRGETLRWPRVLPDGRTVLFVSWPPAGLPGARIGVASLATGEATVLDLAGTAPLGVVDGQLLYVSATGALMAVPFDLASRAVTGAPRALIQGIDINTGVGAARVALSESGTLVYLTGASQGAGRYSRLVTIEPGGASRALLATGNVLAPVWSPDGRRIAVQVTSSEGRRAIGIVDVATGAFEQLPGEGAQWNPTWSPDGRRVIYSSDAAGRSTFWWRPADGSGTPEKLGDGGESGGEAVVSPDGRWLVYLRGAQGAQSLWVTDRTGAEPPRALAVGPADHQTPALSPDGRWLAYASRGAGGYQVYVRPFPGPGGATQVSLDGGQHPVWGGDGKTLYFVVGGRQLVAASLAPGATMGVTGRRELLTSAFLVSANSSRPPFAVSPDGRRFVGLSRLSLNDEAKLVVVTNWLAELRAARGGRPAR